MRKTRDRARAREIPRPGLSRSTRRLINTILFCNRTSASAGSPVLLECSLLASVAQGIEHRSPKAGVDGSNPPGGTSEHDGVARAAPFLVCGTQSADSGRRYPRHPFPAGIVFDFSVAGLFFGHCPMGCKQSRTPADSCHVAQLPFSSHLQNENNEGDAAPPYLPNRLEHRGRIEREARGRKMPCNYD